MGDTEFLIFLSASSHRSHIVTFVMGIMALSLKARGAILFGFLMISIALWCFAIGGQMMSTNQVMSLNWIIAQMLGVVLVPPFWLLFTLSYTDRLKDLHRRMYGLIFLNSVVTMGLLIIPSLRPLLVIELLYDQVSGYLVNVDWLIGPYFWVHPSPHLLH